MTNQEEQEASQMLQNHNVHYVKQLFKNYRYLCMEIERMEEEIKVLKLSKESVQAQQLTDMPKADNSMRDMMTEYVAKLDELERELMQKRIILVDRRTMTESYLDLLPATERLVLEKHYVDGKTWEKVCVEMNYAWMTIHRLHRSALNIIASKMV